MKKQDYLTIPQAAKLLGVSRIAVYKKVKNGQIKAQKIGRNYAIKRDLVLKVFPLSKSACQRLEAAISKTLKEYGETIRLLGRE
jgi:excisionase family DNA binding protein